MSNLKKIKNLLPLLSAAQLNFLNRIHQNQPLENLKKSDLASSLRLIERTAVANAKNEEIVEELIKQNPAKAVAFMDAFPKPYIVDSALLAEMKDFLEYEPQAYTVELPFTYGLAKTPKENQLGVEKFSTHAEALSYYKNEGRELFECGQGFYQDEAEDYCYIEDVFFRVEIKAEIFSQKQDVGDRLYWVDNIKNVEFHLAEERIKQQEERQALEKELIAARQRVAELEERLKP